MDGLDGKKSANKMVKIYCYLSQLGVLLEVQEWTNDNEIIEDHHRASPVLGGRVLGTWKEAETWQWKSGTRKNQRE